MAKAAKKTLLELDPSAPATSYLAAAFYSFERGDSVRTRELAQQVLAGHAAPSDTEAAKLLATKLGLSKNLPEDVAADLIARTRSPAKSFGFAGLAAAIFVLLLTLALKRYGA